MCDDSSLNWPLDTVAASPLMSYQGHKTYKNELMLAYAYILHIVQVKSKVTYSTNPEIAL